MIHCFYVCIMSIVTGIIVSGVLIFDWLLQPWPVKMMIFLYCKFNA